MSHGIRGNKGGGIHEHIDQQVILQSWDRRVVVHTGLSFRQPRMLIRTKAVSPRRLAGSGRWKFEYKKNETDLKESTPEHKGRQ
jgi:hypothetical protein